MSELNKCNTWEEKLKVTQNYFPKLNAPQLTAENQKLLCSTIYNHVIAIQDYDVSSLPPLKSSIILLKPTVMIVHCTEEDYGLQKVNLIRMEICEHFYYSNNLMMRKITFSLPKVKCKFIMSKALIPQ